MEYPIGIRLMQKSKLTRSVKQDPYDITTEASSGSNRYIRNKLAAILTEIQHQAP